MRKIDEGDGTGDGTGGKEGMSGGEESRGERR